MSAKIEHQGVISEIKNNVIHVKINQVSACSGCHARSACGVSESKEKIIEIPLRHQSFHVGDEVAVVGSVGMGLRAVLFAFVIPLLIIVTALVIAMSLVGSELQAALVSILVLALYYSVLYLFRNQLRNSFIFDVKKV